MTRRFSPSLWFKSAGIAASLFLFGCPGGELEPVPEDTAAKCADGQDNDLDGSPDCFDLDCIAFPNCDSNPDPEICSGGVDEDEDGFADCEDPDCANDPACDQTAEICNNDVDDDGDGLTDCDDAGCSQNPQCTANAGAGEGGGPSSNCFDGNDNDNDGDANCDDAECTDECNGANTPEICNNNIDDNFDGRIDCADPQCANEPNCAANGSEICFDGIDNDGVNGTDCSDVDCFNDPACGGGGGGFFEICGNGIDDDGIGGADCADITCLLDPNAGCLPGPGDCDVLECITDLQCLFFDPCCLDPDSFECTGIPPAEVCNNNTDDDFDGVADCNDSDCAAFPACITEICDNNIDDNSDGQPDCRDADCTNSNLCVEICLDTIDNDNDGQLDCADAGCVGSADCTETGAECSDGQDNDLDGQLDCADVQCAGDAACVETGAECQGGVDDDNDGAIDCADTDCSSDPACTDGSCTAPFPVQSGVAINENTTNGSDDQVSTGCGAFGANAPDLTFVLVSATERDYTATLTSAADLGIYEREECGDPDSEFECADDFGTNSTETFTSIALANDPVFITVDGFQGASGAFTLTITLQ